MKVLALGLVLIGLGSSLNGKAGAQGDLRTWVSRSGKKLEATFVGTSAKGVRLQKADGKAGTVRFKHLSARDQEYVASWQLERPGSNLEGALGSTVIAELAFEEAPLSRVFERLTGLYKAEHPDGPELVIDLSRVADKLTGGVTMDLNNIPMSEALMYICRSVGCVHVVQDDSVIVVPRGGDAGMVTRVYFFPEPFLRRLSNDEDAKRLLIPYGVSFPPGASAACDVAECRMDLTNTVDNLQKAERALKGLVEAGVGSKTMRIAVAFYRLNSEQARRLRSQLAGTPNLMRTRRADGTYKKSIEAAMAAATAVRRRGSGTEIKTSREACESGQTFVVRHREGDHELIIQATPTLQLGSGCGLDALFECKQRGGKSMSSGPAVVQLRPKDGVLLLAGLASGAEPPKRAYACVISFEGRSGD